MEEFAVRLIEKVKEYALLYDPCHPDYKNLVKKGETWRVIAEELGYNSETIKQKWKNLRDSYIKYKRYVKGSATAQAVKKYENWPWGRHLEFLNRCPYFANAHINPGSSKKSNTPPLKQDAEISRAPTSSELHPPPTKKNQKSQDLDNVINYLESKNTGKLDGVDHLFLSYAATFKKLSARTQAMLKIELAKLFARAEISEMNAATISSTSQHSKDCSKAQDESREVSILSTAPETESVIFAKHIASQMKSLPKSVCNSLMREIQNMVNRKTNSNRFSVGPQETSRAFEEMLVKNEMEIGEVLIQN